MVPGEGGVEEGGVKVNLFCKKKSCRVKGGRGGRFYVCKKNSPKIYKYALYLLLKCFSNLLFGLQVKPKFQIVTFFLIPTMAEVVLEALLLLMYLWFLQFEQKSIRIVKT